MTKVRGIPKVKAFCKCGSPVTFTSHGKAMCPKCNATYRVRASQVVAARGLEYGHPSPGEDVMDYRNFTIPLALPEVFSATIVTYTPKAKLEPGAWLISQGIVTGIARNTGTRSQFFMRLIDLDTGDVVTSDFLQSSYLFRESGAQWNFGLPPDTGITRVPTGKTEWRLKLELVRWWLF